MKHILALLFLSLLVFMSCSEDNRLNPDPDGDNSDPDNNKKENPYHTNIDLSSKKSVTWDDENMEDEYLMLGYGYDITGNYAHPSSVRSKVINFKELEEDYGDLVTFMMSTSASAELNIGYTRNECVQSLGRYAGLTDEEILKYKKNLFKDKFESAFKDDTSFPYLDYKYLGISEMYVNYHLFYIVMPYMQKRIAEKYVTQEFSSDIDTKSPEEIINKYGTHILTSILIGKRIDHFYRFAEDQNSNSYNWFLFNINSYFTRQQSASTNAQEADPPLKENLYVEVIDGTQHKPNAWMFDITNYKGQHIKFEGWENGSIYKNNTLINFRSTQGVVPIFNFVKEGDKKEALMKAYEKYLTQ